MLNPKTGERELAYVVTIDEIRPIPGYDRVEHARTKGWWVIVRKDQFKVGDLAIYFEVDSKLPAKEPYKFLEAKHYKIKTQKMCKVLSQGLLMSAEDFGWELNGDTIITKKFLFHEGDFLTKELEVRYADDEDNKRKAKSNPDAKINAALARHPKIARKFGKYIKKSKVLRKLFVFFFGRKNDIRTWPSWVVKTDEERIQNCPQILEDINSVWVATEKIDGTSTTATLRKNGKKYDFYICSRNVVYDKPDQPCFYESNPYIEMSEKYKFEEVLKSILEENNLEWVTLQGETYGEGIQKRTYGIDHKDFMAFNLIFSDRGRLGSVEASEIMKKYGIQWVPILETNIKLPSTVDEVLNIATGKSALDGEMREGIVFRSLDGAKSFKAVSNEYLLKYHA